MPYRTPWPPPRPRRSWRTVVALTAALALGTGAALDACATAPRRVAAVTVVSVAGVANALYEANRAAYSSATDDLRERMLGEHKSMDDYRREVAPIAAAFDRRGAAIRALASAVYGAAATIDAAKASATPGEYAAAAGSLLDAIQTAARELQTAGALPPLQLPPRVDEITRALRALTGAS